MPTTSRIAAAATHDATHGLRQAGRRVFGVIGSVTRPFGVFLVSRGLQPGDEDSLRNALLADAGERHSSNGGQSTDVAALKAGDDPNGGAGLAPAYGCSSRAPDLPALLLAAAWLFSKTRLGEGRVRIARLRLRAAAGEDEEDHRCDALHGAFVTPPRDRTRYGRPSRRPGRLQAP